APTLSSQPASTHSGLPPVVASFHPIGRLFDSCCASSTDWPVLSVAPCVCWTIAARRLGSRHSTSATWSVLMLNATTTSAARASSTSLTHRLYQPLSRSIVSPYQAWRSRSNRSTSLPADSTSGFRKSGTWPLASASFNQARTASMSLAPPASARTADANVDGVMYEGVHRSDRTSSIHARTPFSCRSVTATVLAFRTVSASLRALLKPLTSGCFQNSAARSGPSRALIVLNSSEPRRFSTRAIASLRPEQSV